MARNTIASLVLASVLTSVLVSSAPAGATGQPAMPAQLRAIVNIVGHSYSHGYHHASGKLRLNNTSGHQMKLACTVTVTWTRKNGMTARRSDDVSVDVGAGAIRKVHFHVRFHDKDALFLNVPVRGTPHCRTT